MGDRPKRPLNQAAVKAADDQLYQNHAADPRPNALFDEDGNRKPLDANDPDQASLRKEWMDSYKANGGETEPAAATGHTPADEGIVPCDQRPVVNPLIVGLPVTLDESDEGIDESEPDEGTDEPEPEEAEEDAGDGGADVDSQAV